MKKSIVILLLAVSAAFCAGYLIRRVAGEIAAAPPEMNTQTWTCALHPEVKTRQSGNCPLCGMGLTILKESPANAGTASTAAASDNPTEKTVETTTATVERKYVALNLSLPGTVVFDGSGIIKLAACFPGKVEKINIAGTGAQVKKGSQLAELSNPEIPAIRKQLRIASEQLREANADNDQEAAAEAQAALKESKCKIWAWNIIPALSRIDAGTAESSDYTGLTAPIAGIVQKTIAEGAVFNKGDVLLTIADPHKLRLLIHASPQDAAWLKYGQKITVTAAAAGKTYEGIIVGTDATKTDMKGTVIIPAAVNNPDGSLQPGTAVKADIPVKIADGGNVVITSLTGRWLCPAHPEIIAGKPGKCETCGSSFIPAESVGDGRTPPPALVIPATAPLTAGKKALVFLVLPDGRYESREITLGHRVGNNYIVTIGLKEGDIIAADGKFISGSIIQVTSRQDITKESLNRETSPENIQPDLQEPRKMFGGTLEFYFNLQDNLSNDDLPSCRKEAEKLAAFLKPYADKPAQPAPREDNAICRTIYAAAATISNAVSLNNARVSFAGISQTLYPLLKNRGGQSDKPIYVGFYTPAGQKEEILWMQNHSEIANPYLGAAAREPGEIREIIMPAESSAANP